ncbi:hypothetical protein [Coleofasciculus sp. LEGE 07092]|uniref:hypothetical protein n=1 Tax=Coleofasciculus sp. LEGE 07092 TaxID=2777969 RepID=UPI0018825D31|nr:hypothetical protein [Coleofasciculus sp. LEGE 07092]MBE9151045.1 hypothetical protein [Coleofasciculus sp. LEGE 07092]
MIRAVVLESHVLQEVTQNLMDSGIVDCDHKDPEQVGNLISDRIQEVLDSLTDPSEVMHLLNGQRLRYAIGMLPDVSDEEVAA